MDNHQESDNSSGGERRQRRRFGILAAVAGFLVVTLVWSLAFANTTPTATLKLTKPRVVILKHARVLHLFDGDQLMRTYPIDLGTAPIGDKMREGDCRTPEGRFRVMTKNSESAFHRFMGFDYPNRQAVERGLKQGLLSAGEAAKLIRELKDGLPVDGATALGGGIGIHGERRGNDWTGGCVALENDHVTELFAVLRLGDEVEILP